MRLCGVDVGGTFTDLIYFNSDSGEIIVEKVPSTPTDQSIGVENGLNLLKRQFPDFNLDALVHGSTVGTNAILERKGARTAFITTKGFKDIIEIGRQNRLNIYDLNPKRPVSFVPEELRYGIKERVNSEGEIITPLDELELNNLIDFLKSTKPESLAVSLIFSFFNKKHEQLVSKYISKEFPNLHTSLSSNVLPEFREYERSSTTILDAYIAPLMKRYFTSFIQRIKANNLDVSPLILLSNGGVTQIKGAASRKSVETVISGLAGGVLGGLTSTREMDHLNALTLDIGGTSTDVACIKDGKNEITRENRIGGVPLKISAMDVQTIGAGGGSIARLDKGIITVGPESAGAEPGPACYGKGGKIPTVTDANLVLGMFDPNYFCGGTVTIHSKLAEEAIGELSKQSGFNSLEECAAGIIEIYETNITLALRKVSTERGHDAREFSLIAFGGGGPLHACSLVDRLSMKDAIIPPFPGAWSAFGLLTADIRHDLSQSYLKDFSMINDEHLDREFTKLEVKGLELCKADGFELDRVYYKRMIDIRLKGQSYEITVPFNGNLKEASAEFDRIHKQLYGYSVPEEERVLVNLFLSSFVRLPKFSRNDLPIGDQNPYKSAIKGIRKVYVQGKWVEAKIYDRWKLLANNVVEGPCIIEQTDSTTFVDNNWEGVVHKNGHILLRRRN